MLAVCTLPVLARGAAAQSTLETAVRQLNSGNAQGYLQPLPELLSANLGAGWFRSGIVGDGSLAIRLELHAAFSAVEPRQREYSATTPAGFTPTAFETATVFGGSGTLVSGPSNTSYRGSDGVLQGDLLPGVLPQVRISYKGTEGIFRYFTSEFAGLHPEGFPETSVVGFGLRHSVSQYFDSSPVDLALAVQVNTFDLGTQSATGISASYDGLALALQASRRISALTLYGGVTSDGGEMKVTFTSTSPDEPEPVHLSLDVPRSLRFTAGLGLSLGIVGISGEITVGELTTFSGGLRIGK
jgi:hypothetical protein